VPFMIDNKSMPISKSIISLAELISQKCKEMDEPIEVKKTTGQKLF
jgi:hypothetical protein